MSTKHLIALLESLDLVPLVQQLCLHVSALLHSLLKSCLHIEASREVASSCASCPIAATLSAKGVLMVFLACTTLGMSEIDAFQQREQ